MGVCPTTLFSMFLAGGVPREISKGSESKVGPEDRSHTRGKKCGKPARGDMFHPQAIENLFGPVVNMFIYGVRGLHDFLSLLGTPTVENRIFTPLPLWPGVVLLSPLHLSVCG